MTHDAASRTARFRALHDSGIFVIANAWDAGSARMLEGMGFEAIATSSGAHANTLGRHDGRVTRQEALAHGRAIVEAVQVPVAADLEKGFGDAPAAAAETIRLAGAAGLCGGSIEDSSGDKSNPIYGIAQAAERIAAAVEAARALAFPLCSRRARRTSSPVGPTSTTPSFACRRSRRRARTYCSRRACRRSTP